MRGGATAKGDKDVQGYTSTGKMLNYQFDFVTHKMLFQKQLYALKPLMQMMTTSLKVMSLSLSLRGLVNRHFPVNQEQLIKTQP